MTLRGDRRTSIARDGRHHFVRFAASDVSDAGSRKSDVRTKIQRWNVRIDGAGRKRGEKRRGRVRHRHQRALKVDLLQSTQLGVWPRSRAKKRCRRIDEASIDLNKGTNERRRNEVREWRFTLNVRSSSVEWRTEAKMTGTAACCGLFDSRLGKCS